MESGHHSEGGDPACWLGLICPACGRVREDRTTSQCENCGEELDEAGAGGAA
ncbi:hypothetical protein [Streptomyces smaragdinus]|uniref:hypothetical protein n=1 Tax=Streptomyces smaragdinus TaxID=2585196 RepID=UPI001295A6E2|nr:hypothetical protein [Streptomyces smaragdinus]